MSVTTEPQAQECFPEKAAGPGSGCFFGHCALGCRVERKVCQCLRLASDLGTSGRVRLWRCPPVAGAGPGCQEKGESACSHFISRGNGHLSWGTGSSCLSCAKFIFILEIILNNAAVCSTNEMVKVIVYPVPALMLSLEGVLLGCLERPWAFRHWCACSIVLFIHLLKHKLDSCPHAVLLLARSSALSVSWTSLQISMNSAHEFFPPKSTFCKLLAMSVLTTQ